MSIGLFLDVDRALTVDLIQRRFAQLMGVGADYETLESEFHRGSITSADFAKRLIGLFNASGFSRDFADKHYGDVALQDWTDDLLRLPQEFPLAIYLVSSGPSYYVERLADAFGIGRSNVLCSIYSFDADGKLSRCNAVSQQTKADFVRRKSVKHAYTIGVGDDASHDGPFLSCCDIPILTARSEGFLFVESLQIIRTLVSNLSRNLQTPARTRPTVFIGSSKEKLRLAEALHSLIDEACDPTVWRNGVFVPSSTNIEALEGALGRFDFAVFIMAPEDTTTRRGISDATVRDNVVFELGLFMGRLGRNRCFLVFPRGERPKLPSDLAGIVMIDYADDRIESDVVGAFTSTASTLKNAITDLGCRSFRL